MLIIMKLMVKINGIKQHQQVVLSPIVMVCMIWRVMSTNGVRIGLTVIKNIRCYRAVLGSLISMTCG